MKINEWNPEKENLKSTPFWKEKRDVLEEKGYVSQWQQLVEDARVVSRFGNRRTDSGIQLGSEGQKKWGYTESATVKKQSITAATGRKQKNLRSHLSLQPTPTPHMYGNLLQTAGPRQREPLKFASNQRINTLPVSAMAF